MHWKNYMSFLMVNLYYMNIISTKEKHNVLNQNFMNQNKFVVWHDRLDYLESILMRKIFENSCGHTLKS